MMSYTEIKVFIFYKNHLNIFAQLLQHLQLNMCRFIKLSSTIINVNKIVQINIYPKSFYIHLDNNSIRGILLFSFGSVSTTENFITIFEEREPKDYEIMRRFIEQLDDITQK